MGLLKFSDGLPDCQNGKITLRKPLRHSGGVSEEFSGSSDTPAGWPKSSAARPTLRPVGRKVQRLVRRSGRLAENFSGAFSILVA